MNEITRKNIFMQGMKNKLSYVFNYKDLGEVEKIIDFYEEQLKQKDEVIDEATEWLKDYQKSWVGDEVYSELNEPLDILKKGRKSHEN